MKASIYNYVVKNKDTYILFNGISEFSFMVPDKNKDIYMSILNNPDANYNQFKSFVDKMKDKGFILEDDASDESLLKQKFDMIRRPHDYHIMILPTYQCNLRCWYCVQNHNDLKLSDKDVTKIKKRIERAIDNDEIHNMHISWFGGEPLLEFKRIVEISEWAIDLCEKLGKNYTASITTNSILLTPERIEFLRKLNVRTYQITIDGDRETHNNIKILGKESAFDIALKNVAEITKHTKCLLRYNYTKDNLKPESIIADIQSVLPAENRKNISFQIHRVWQEIPENINPADVMRLASNAEKVGLVPRMAITGMCYTDQKNFDCIFANGKVGKCDNADLDSNHVCGTIDNSGDIVWEHDNLSLLTIFDEESHAEECISCRYLPICWGPCNIKRESMLLKDGYVKCQFQDKDIEMAENIRNLHFNAIRQKEAAKY